LPFEFGRAIDVIILFVQNLSFNRSTVHTTAKYEKYQIVFNISRAGGINHQPIKIMKTISTIITAILLSAGASQAEIDGFSFYSGSGLVYTVPTGKILVLEQVAFTSGTTAANAILVVNSHNVNLPAATNGLYTLPKSLFLTAGTTVSAGTALGTLFGVVIDTSDAPLFVGGGSSLGNVTVANNIMTGVLQLSSTAPSKVIIQSSTNLVDWSYDSSVVVQRGSDKTKFMFTAPVSGSGKFYRALVRQTSDICLD
jgi:hypothetical protein